VLTTAKVRSVPIPLPPIEEQQRIVAAIEEQFSRLDAGLASMRHARNGADRLVQALVDHELASDRHHPTWQALTPHDLADEGRNSLTIGPFGSDLKVSDYTEHGVPLVFVRNIRSQSFAGNGTKYVSLEKAEALRSHRVVGGDVLITKMGDPPGDTAVYPHELPEAIITADCIKLTPKPSYDPHFIALALSTQSSRRQFAVITSGVAQQKVSLARFRHGIRLAVPPHAEQLEIVRRIDEARSTLAVTNRVIDQSEQRALSLRSSILSAAFTGKLVPQDSTDEPAFVLLERIAAERATSNGRKPSRSARRAPLL
jgi:type I restriction enzyme S subunit